MASIPKKPGVHKVGGRYYRRLANGKVKFAKAPARSASTARRSSTPAKRAAPSRRKRTMPMKNMVDLKAVSAGAITGVASTFAQNIPGLGAYAPAVGLAVGGSFAGDASTKKTAHFLAGMSLGNALTGSVAPGAASSGGLL